MNTAQSFLDIADIRADLLILAGGSACLLLEVDAINFGLFSEKEQEATIYSYAQLLNSLTFSIQIVISSKRKDVTDYINSLEEQLNHTSEPKIKLQITKYRDFIKSIVRQSNVLDKKFYIAIPFSSLELGVGSAVGQLGGQKPKELKNIDSLVERANTNLIPKRDHLLRMLGRIGLRARQLNSQELLQLFFDQYNREQFGVKVEIPNSL